ncbi:MAG: rhodanese-like domain-containing protein [Beutenbergiaceae bacterium]
MAVTTGTTWDIVLNAAPAPIARTVSPREAYQAALYGRAVVVDLRSERRRAAAGYLPSALAAVVGRRELEVWLQESLAQRILLLDHDGERAVRLARGGDRRVTAITGGFAAWQGAELPVEHQRSGPSA